MTIIKGQRYWHSSRSRECTVVSKPFKKVAAGGNNEVHSFVRVQDDTGLKWDAMMARLSPMQEAASEHAVQWVMGDGELRFDIGCTHAPRDAYCDGDFITENLSTGEFTEAYNGEPTVPRNGSITTTWIEGTPPDEPGPDSTIRWNYV